MKFGESRRHPLRVPPPGSGTKARVLPLWPQRWRILVADQRTPLWLPLPDSPSDRRCLAHFISGRGKAFYGRALLSLSEWMPCAGLLPEIDMPKSIRGILSFDLPVASPWRAVIRISAPGAEQRACVLFLSLEGMPVAFAKVATVPSADPGIATEVEWLQRIGHRAELSGQVPEILDQGSSGNGRRYFVTTPARNAQPAGRLGRLHADFLAALGRMHMDVQRFEFSPLVRRLGSMLARLQPGIDRKVGQNLRAALQECVDALGPWEGPVVTAHGDFAPANVRVHDSGIFVFDWEHAHTGANPLTDVLHFVLAPRAVTTRGVTLRAFRAALREAYERARDIYPEWNWHYTAVAAHALAYLIEATLRRCAVNQCFDKADPLVRSYWNLLEIRSTWLKRTLRL